MRPLADGRFSVFLTVEWNRPVSFSEASRAGRIGRHAPDQSLVAGAEAILSGRRCGVIARSSEPEQSMDGWM